MCLHLDATGVVVPTLFVDYQLGVQVGFEDHDGKPIAFLPLSEADVGPHRGGFNWSPPTPAPVMDVVLTMLPQTANTTDFNLTFEWDPDRLDGARRG
jgi:hypothetical protein